MDHKQGFDKDRRHHDLMRLAANLALRGQGKCAPNPSVGCVIVAYDGKIIATGSTSLKGRPHGEAIALKRAGNLARGASVYVSLEPCAHIGQTGPCCQLLIDAGIKACHIGVVDPAPHVCGKGIERLKKAGIEVSVGAFLEETCRFVTRGHLLKYTRSRPSFTLKTATSLDGKIALKNQQSKWITGGQARAFNQLLRASHDGILIGSNTALKDDPALDCRLEGYRHPDFKVILLDRRLRVPASARLMAQNPLIYSVKTQSVDPEREAQKKRLQDAGALVIECDGADDDAQSWLKSVAGDLASKGLGYILIEGGGQVAASFLKAQMVDLLYHMRCNKLIGGDGQAMIGDLGIEEMGLMVPFEFKERLQFGVDHCDIWQKAEPEWLS
ncbi:MAG: bifunctional diaminohydroxyphosphoribosylaminopyrimidine deaminase/5-amino-6-(5-phosphoribosylamino)uracil reductase RibD [Pseudomonadota bacterium]